METNFAQLVQSDKNTNLDKSGNGTNELRLFVKNFPNNEIYHQFFILHFRSFQLVGLSRKSSVHSKNCLWYRLESLGNQVWFSRSLEELGKQERVELRKTGDQFTGGLKIKNPVHSFCIFSFLRRSTDQHEGMGLG